MPWYEWIALVSLMVCIANCIYHAYRIIRLGKPPEYSRRSGSTGRAIMYSFSGAMSPKVKESAYLHLPTYLAGIIYHIGTFIAISLFFIFMAGLRINGWPASVVGLIMIISGLCGVSIFIKRTSKHELRSLSNPDDYISNILVTLFQLSTAYFIFSPSHEMYYFIVSALLLLYFPLGKLKHAVYFFAARYHLGLFYGWRGVWPPKSMNN